MAYGTRLSQMQKEMDLMSNQVGEIAEIKSQIMALTASMNTISNTMSTLIKDKAACLEQGETHRDRYAEFPRERQHYNEEEYHGGYRKYKVRGKMDFLRFEGENPIDWLYKAK
jgi:hypothetical protein